VIPSECLERSYVELKRKSRVVPYSEAEKKRERDTPPLVRTYSGRVLHSSTSQLNVSTLHGIHWVVSMPKTAQVELRSGPV